MLPTTIFLSVPLLLAVSSSAYTLDCKNIVIDRKQYNFGKLTGPHSVRITDKDRPPAIRNATWTIDICQPLRKSSDIPASSQCHSGTNVCGIKDAWDPEADPDKKSVVITEVIDIAGSIHDTGSALDPQITRLNSTDTDKDGLRIELRGGLYSKRKQRAVVEFICDKDRTGNEGNDQAQGDGGAEEKKRDEENDDTPEVKTSLMYVSYGPAEDNDNMDILRLDWKTKYACEDYVPGDDDDEDDQPSKKGGWGFFTWFIVLFFLGASAYLIFGSWLNYNRYGARGWDLLPHGDTIRDVPYIFKDFSRKVLDTFSGGGSRGGYSAV